MELLVNLGPPQRLIPRRADAPPDRARRGAAGGARGPGERWTESLEQAGSFEQRVEVVLRWAEERYGRSSAPDGNSAVEG